MAIGTATCQRKASPERTGEATSSLEAYCKAGACRRYDDALANVRSRGSSGASCSRAETGSCGTLRYVEFSDGFWGFVEYFDESGAMVGAKGWSDIAPRKNYGTVPDCKPLAIEQLCTGMTDR